MSGSAGNDSGGWWWTLSTDTAGARGAVRAWGVGQYDAGGVVGGLRRVVFVCSSLSGGCGCLFRLGRLGLFGLLGAL